MVESKEKILS